MVNAKPKIDVTAGCSVAGTLPPENATISSVGIPRQTRNLKRGVESVDVNATSEASASLLPNNKTDQFPVSKKPRVGTQCPQVQPTINGLDLSQLKNSDVSALSTEVTTGMAVRKNITARKSAKAQAEPSTILVDKPAAIGAPNVWCDTRQELCESLPTFRSYQGGCYASKGFGRGYLVDGHSSERDYMDASIIISHAGGNSEEVDGERRLVKDQTWDKGTIANLRNNCEQMVPLMVIVGERCPTAPAKLLHRYSVMDWFKVTHCWPEKDSSSGKIRCKFRLEKLDSSERGWWAAADTPGVSADLAIEYVSCQGCKQESPYIYDGEPMCLNKDCNRYWTVFSGRSKKAPEHFIYRKTFLHGKTIWPETAIRAPGPLAPTLPVGDEHTENSGRDVKRRFWKGICCPKCGKLNCRELWRNWNCTNCDWEFAPKRSHFIPADLSDPHRPDFTGPPIPENVVDPSIKAESTILADGRRAITYHLFHCGKVIHILANKTWNALPRGADWLLDRYQDVNMPFKRHELKTHKLTGRLLTQQFSFNSGAPYKYIVEVDSLPFEKSPEVVRQALKTLQADVSQAIPGALPMNEILNVAYFEEQKMDFHDDGEVDLGPCVSSISLGSPAMMYFRVKAKYCTGNISASDKALLQPSNPRCLDAKKGEAKRQSKRNILELRLHHGDVMIMDGRSIQRLLEHAVTPEGFRIAATARNISSRNTIANAMEAGKAIPKNSAVTADSAANDKIKIQTETAEVVRESQTPIEGETYVGPRLGNTPQSYPQATVSEESVVTPPTENVMGVLRPVQSPVVMVPYENYKYRYGMYNMASGSAAPATAMGAWAPRTIPSQPYVSGQAMVTEPIGQNNNEILEPTAPQNESSNYVSQDNSMLVASSSTPDMVNSHGGDSTSIPIPSSWSTEQMDRLRSLFKNRNSGTDPSM
ncbi:hypothetical protein ABW19_dt0206953 [Dactylella cylindrospora]|nr:hypothetical protein ABW19_dt0206953 [Dactylella cylindrospora]